MLLSEKGQRIFNWIGYVMGMTILSGSAVLYCSVHRREALANELWPYVERADGQPGLSKADMLDFARRAQLPEQMIKDINYGADFRLEYYLPHQLETALKSYHEQEPNKR